MRIGLRPSPPPGGCLHVCQAETPLSGSLRWCDLELQVLLTLAEPARVARGTVAVAGADVEISVVPTAHATWVSGDLCSDKEGTLKGGLVQAGAFLGAEAQGSAPQDAATLL